MDDEKIANLAQPTVESAMRRLPAPSADMSQMAAILAAVAKTSKLGLQGAVRCDPDLVILMHNASVYANDGHGVAATSWVKKELARLIEDYRDAMFRADRLLKAFATVERNVEEAEARRSAAHARMSI